MEVFEDIPGYKGLYQINKFGKVKGVKRGLLLSQTDNGGGYLVVTLSKNNKPKLFGVHQLVAMTFLGHKPNKMKNIVDHKDNCKQNNFIDNLQVISQRKNTSKDKRGFSSEFIGVSWNKFAKKWSVYITIKGIKNHLGYFNCELKAAFAYQNKLKELAI